MEQAIKDLEQQVEVLKNAYKQKQREEYESSLHKSFEVGDWVTNGKHVGVVEWIENKARDFLRDDGYMGVDLKNGSLGFRAGTKRNMWDLLEGDLRKYYTENMTIEIELTGEDINRLKYDLGSRNINPSTIKTKLLDILDAVRPQ